MIIKDKEQIKLIAFGVGSLANSQALKHFRGQLDIPSCPYNSNNEQ